jgi:mRNA-degrading endonuclease RelE of RelBE toxin-antitoxin system
VASEEERRGGGGGPEEHEGFRGLPRRAGSEGGRRFRRELFRLGITSSSSDFHVYILQIEKKKGTKISKLIFSGQEMSIVRRVGYDATWLKESPKERALCLVHKN